MIWFAPVLVLLAGFAALAVLARSIDRELAQVTVEQARWARMGTRLGRLRATVEDLGVGGQDLRHR